MTVSFVVPIRTVNGQNQRTHWAVRAKKAKADRQATTWAALAAGFKMCRCGKRGCVMWTWAADFWAQGPRGKLWVTLTRVAPQALDDDGNVASFKAVRDQVAAHLGIDDRSKDVAWNYAQRKGGVREYAVEIDIREAP
jgi:hypothetical protein